MTRDCGCKYEYHTLDNLHHNLGYGSLEDIGSLGFPIAIAFINLKFMVLCLSNGIHEALTRLITSLLKLSGHSFTRVQQLGVGIRRNATLICSAQ